ncbi:DUF3369 domain-containing protein, partial [Dokdonella sp.]|uniref:DUF3369 domain-containing protein n=1 Tax=Dokdonella sp. TaxID=2291710 RepID=UPI002C615BDD
MTLLRRLARCRQPRFAWTPGLLRGLHVARLRLEKIIDASARIFELQSLKKFASGVLEQLSGLVTLERDALYMGMGGFTATKEGEG